MKKLILALMFSVITFQSVSHAYVISMIPYCIVNNFPHDECDLKPDLAIFIPPFILLLPFAILADNENKTSEIDTKELLDQGYSKEEIQEIAVSWNDLKDELRENYSKEELKQMSISEFSEITSNYLSLTSLN
ncbi:MAG: hypothetical protein KAQ98_04525 [Bacteriovoracaceae bacterium]|nr:hypothetical protein [Bacteriovoracaceae bacterium]